MLKKNDIVLFQGDSITDAGRDRTYLELDDSDSALGCGYVQRVAGMLREQRPEANLRFGNRGIGGDAIQQLLQRWQSDCLKLNPNVLSVLIGINDAARMINGIPGHTVENFDRDYRLFLDLARAHNPKLRMLICEPFALLCGQVNAEWMPGLEARQKIASTVADDYGASFVPFQSLFNAMTADAPAAHWLPDGVHPTPEAHLRMAKMWIECAVRS